MVSDINTRLFEQGRLVITAEVCSLFLQERLEPLLYLRRHLQGDWGNVSKATQNFNFDAVRGERQLFSAYQVDDEIDLFVITAADRSTTTILLAAEYSGRPWDPVSNT